MREKYCVIVWDSFLGGCTKKYFTLYDDLCGYLNRLDGMNCSTGMHFLWSVYSRDFKNKKWVYIGGFDGK